MKKEKRGWLSLKVGGNAVAGEQGAAQAAESVDGFRAFIVGVVNQAEVLIAQKAFEFAGGKRCGHASLQSGWIHESGARIWERMAVSMDNGNRCAIHSGLSVGRGASILSA